MSGLATCRLAPREVILTADFHLEEAKGRVRRNGHHPSAHVTSSPACPEPHLPQPGRVAAGRQAGARALDGDRGWHHLAGRGSAGRSPLCGGRWWHPWAVRKKGLLPGRPAPSGRRHPGLSQLQTSPLHHPQDTHVPRFSPTGKVHVWGPLGGTFWSLGEAVSTQGCLQRGGHLSWAGRAPRNRHSWSTLLPPPPNRHLHGAARFPESDPSSFLHFTNPISQCRRTMPHLSCVCHYQINWGQVSSSLISR